MQSVKTINCAHYAADSFTVELALQGQPATADWAAGDGWVEDLYLGLAIGGGYDPPLTDQKAAVAAARANADFLRRCLDEQDQRLQNAKQAASGAKALLAAAEAVALIKHLVGRYSQQRSGRCGRDADRHPGGEPRFPRPAPQG